MNFNQIIKEEWEKEFPEAAELCTYENSLAIIYEQMIEKICVRVWNEAVQTCIGNIQLEKDGFDEAYIDTENLINLIIDEQGTDTPEV